MVTIQQLTYTGFLNKVFDMHREYNLVTFSSSGLKSNFFSKFEHLYTFDESVELEYTGENKIEIFKNEVKAIEFKESFNVGTPNELTVILENAKITFQYE